MKVICIQSRDGIPDEDPIVIPPLKGEIPTQTLQRKFKGAEYRDWNVEPTSDGFHAWKEYSDGDGTVDRPNRKDRYFKLVK